MPKPYIIDAEGKKLGRLASEIALLLQGKRAISDLRMPPIIEVRNAKGLSLSAKKRSEVWVRRHTGYPGSVKEETLASFFAKSPKRVLMKAVAGMLPKNRSRAKALRRLRIS